MLHVTQIDMLNTVVKIRSSDYLNYFFLFLLTFLIAYSCYQLLFKDILLVKSSTSRIQSNKSMNQFSTLMWEWCMFGCRIGLSFTTIHYQSNVLEHPDFSSFLLKKCILQKVFPISVPEVPINVLHL